jgi:hypothetical protein
MRANRANLPVDSQLRNIRRVIMGISFGTGNSDLGKNIQGWDSGNIVTPATPNTAFSVPHNLGYVPTRFQVHYISEIANVGDGVSVGGAAWSKTAISLACSVASATVRVFIL